MLTRIEIDGFKTFEKLQLDLRPFTAVIGPNASGKSNLFDALQFLSKLSQVDIRTAMQDLRGEPEELFRQTSKGPVHNMKFAVEVLLDVVGRDAFGTEYIIKAQRLRYVLELGLLLDSKRSARGVVVRNESCVPLAKGSDRASFLRGLPINYNSTVNPFIRLNDSQDAILVRQDGRQKHGRPVTFSLKEASRTALSTISTAEFPHLFALREALGGIRFLEITPSEARKPNDRFENRMLKPDASNLSAVLARLKEETATKERPNGILADIASDLASLIPSVSEVSVQNDPVLRQYSFDVAFGRGMSFSSRVISDGTIRLLSLLTVLHDPRRLGTLCFEEPENGVHEGRIPMLINLLRRAATDSLDPNGLPLFQVILNTHSPKVMQSLLDEEIVAADMVVELRPRAKAREIRTRMRTGVARSSDLFDPERNLTRSEVERVLQTQIAAA